MAKTNHTADIVELALGRILRMAARPAQPGDIAEYDRCRVIILNELGDAPPSYEPNWMRDRLNGATGG